MVSKKEEDFHKKWAKVIAKAWSDPIFKEKLLKNPQQILKEFDIIAPACAQIKIIEESDGVFQLILPKKPSSALSEEELHKIAAAGIPRRHICSPRCS